MPRGGSYFYLPFLQTLLAIVFSHTYNLTTKDVESDKIYFEMSTFKNQNFASISIQIFFYIFMIIFSLIFIVFNYVSD